MKLVMNSESVTYFACAKKCDHSEVRILKFVARNHQMLANKKLIILAIAEDTLYFPYEQMIVWGFVRILTTIPL
jgi:hypothetical protein